MPPKKRKTGAQAKSGQAKKKAAPKKAPVSAVQKQKVLGALEDKMKLLKREIAVAQGEYAEAKIREECGEDGGVMCSAKGCGDVGSYNADGDVEDEDGSWGECDGCSKMFCSNHLQSPEGFDRGEKYCEPYGTRSASCLREKYADDYEQGFD